MRLNHVGCLDKNVISVVGSVEFKGLVLTWLSEKKWSFTKLFFKVFKYLQYAY